MTPFTSFVAVEERIVTEGGILRRVLVPVEMPDGVNYHSVFGSSSQDAAKMMRPMAAAPAGGVVGGVVGGIFGGLMRESAAAPPLNRNQALVTNQRDEKAETSRLDTKVQAWIKEAREGRLKGEVEVEIFLTSIAPEVLGKLKQLGFRATVSVQEPRRLIGRIAAEKLEALVRLPEILYLSSHSAR
jgi:hypothetical protein